MQDTTNSFYIKKYCPYCKKYYLQADNRAVNCPNCKKRVPQLGTIRNSKGVVME